MKKILIPGLFLCLVSCGANDKSGIYTITDYYYESSTEANEQQLQEETRRDRPDVLGTKLMLTQYDNSLMFRAHSGETVIAKEITDIDFQQEKDSIYTGRDHKETFELTISGKKIFVKEILSNYFSEYDYEKTVIVFVLTKDK